jgi:NADH:ubiquinone oxidoreductase subunit 4 (subunit M)
MIYLISQGSGSLLSKTRAIYRFSLYTIIGGLLLLLVIIILTIKSGSLNYYYYICNSGYIFNYKIQLMLFIIGIIPYLIKLPIIPFHI